jgi:adenylate cyclase
MGDNEEATLNTLTLHRKLITSNIQQHHGHVVNSVGDSLLAEFASVVEAVNSAVEIQAALKGANDNLPPVRRMEFRIGVNLGDVIVDGDQIYGDGVNVAARLENLAEPGGICISGVVHDQVRDKLALSYEDSGEQTVKNIARPVRVWRVLLGQAPQPERRPSMRRYWRRSALAAAAFTIIAGTFVIVQHVSIQPQSTHASVPAPLKPALTLPTIPSIAVLPFVNVSGDPQQGYFSDGITDDLTTDLSRLPNLFVIARSSSFTYKGNPENVQDIGRELGVRYLLEGSVRKAANQVRVNVQLIDAASGNQIWANRYDRKLADIFKLQDDIVHSLITTLGLQLSVLFKGGPIRQQTSNMEAYDYCLRGVEQLFNFTPNALAEAARMFEKAIALDPAYSDPYVGLAYLDWIRYAWQLNTHPQLLQSAEQLARKAISLDGSNSEAYAVLGSVEFFQNAPSQALADARHSIEIDPSNPFAYLVLSDISSMLGKPEAQLAYAEKALRLDPNHPETYSLEVGSAYNQLGKYQQALTALKAGIPNDPWTHVNLAYTYEEIGREQDAREEVAEVRRLAPKFSLEDITRKMRLDWNAPVPHRYLEDLHKAGLK